MERKDAIEILKKLIEAMQGYITVLPSPERIVAIRVAISSLETDEAYQLEYENPEFCADCISREAVKEILPKMAFTSSEKYIQALSKIELLPSVHPKSEQEPRKGHWTEEFNDLEGEVRFTCSSCGKYQLFGTDFCYNCGSDNREVEE